jgi:hypothetical protein
MKLGKWLPATESVVDDDVDPDDDVVVDPDDDDDVDDEDDENRIGARSWRVRVRCPAGAAAYMVGRRLWRRPRPAV